MEAKSTRFVEFSERNYSSTIHNFYSEFISEYIAKIRKAKWDNLKWKGLTLMKDPMSLSIYQQMLQDLKPKTILEFGTYEGGSALWMKDILQSIGADCQIHTFDINKEQIKLPPTDGIFFHQLDNNEIVDYVAQNRKFFRTLRHPLLVIEDSHVNAGELLTCIGEFLEPGDYLVVEDTLSEDKYEMLENFLKDSKYLVDSHYCDFWGYNNSWNLNSFLKKI